MAEVILLMAIVLIAVLSPFYGVDSRRVDDRGWFAAPR